MFDIWIPSYLFEAGDDENKYDDWAGEHGLSSEFDP